MLEAGVDVRFALASEESFGYRFIEAKGATICVAF